MRDIWEEIKEDWAYRLPYRWKYNRYSGLSHDSYGLLWLLYYSAKSIVLLFCAMLKYILFDVWGDALRLKKGLPVKAYKMAVRKEVCEECLPEWQDIARKACYILAILIFMFWCMLGDAGDVFYEDYAIMVSFLIWGLVGTGCMIRLFTDKVKE